MRFIIIFHFYLRALYFVQPVKSTPAGLFFTKNFSPEILGCVRQTTIFRIHRISQDFVLCFLLWNPRDSIHGIWNTTPRKKERRIPNLVDFINKTKSTGFSTRFQKSVRQKKKYFLQYFHNIKYCEKRGVAERTLSFSMGDEYEITLVYKEQFPSLRSLRIFYCEAR